MCRCGQALEGIMASVCASHRTQSPLLPHALVLFGAAVADPNPTVAALGSQGLAVCEVGARRVPGVGAGLGWC